jgi:hypothetical protein
MDCFRLDEEALAIDVGDKDKVGLSRGDRQCHMGKACSKAPPFGVYLWDLSGRSISVAFSTLRQTDRLHFGGAYR